MTPLASLRTCLFIGYIVAALGIGAAPAQAQGTGAVEGTVTTIFEEPIGGAEVSIVGENQSTTTGGDGQYRFSGLTEGQYTLQASADTFQTAEQIIEIIADSTITRDLFLDPGLVVEYASETSRGSSFDVEVAIPDGFLPIETGLFFRPTGMFEYQSTTLNSTGPTTFEASVPESAVTIRGLEFYVRVEFEGAVATAPSRSPSELPFSVTVQASELQAPLSLRPEQYTMVSVPLDLEEPSAQTVLEDDYGPQNPAQWRLLRWDREAEQYEDVGGGDTTAEMRPGQAFWLVTRDGAPFDVENAQSPEEGPATISLSPDWNQVANPNPYSVAWSDVEGGELVEAPVAFDPDAPPGESYRFGVPVLEPWTGYWVYNPEPEAISLTFPEREAEETENVATTRKAARSGLEALFDADPLYSVQLEARLDRAGGTPLYDTKNVVGIARGEGASARETVPEPPPVGDHVRLSVLTGETRSGEMPLAGSLRPAGGRGQSWDLKVTAEAGEEASVPHAVQLRVKERGARPSGYKRRLFDRRRGRRIPIDGNTATLSLTSDTPSRHLRLLLGTEAYLEDEAKKMRPQETALEPPYPNPSRGAVAIDYQLRTAQHVSISVYDVLGRRIRTLVDERKSAGPHTVHWEGEASSLGSGVYFVQMEAASTSSTERVVLVR